MKTILRLTILTAMASTIFAAKDPKHDQAEQLIKEGKALEQQDKLLEARDKYTEAAKSWSGAGKDLNEVNKKITAKTAEIIKSAKVNFDAKEYTKAIDQLQDAHKLSPNKASVSCDLGVAYHGAGNDAKAVENLQACVAGLTKADEKGRYQQLITQIDTGDKPLTLDAPQKDTLESFNKSLRENDDALSTASADSDLCKKLLENQGTLPKTPSVLFNLAKCSEAAGQLEEASRYFSDYLKAAPDSRTVPEAKDASAQLESILAYGGGNRDEVRNHYRAASQSIARGQYGTALKEYEAVREIAPEFGFGRRQLGLFYEALGRTDEAAKELNAYAALNSTAAEEREWAKREIAGLGERRVKYDAAVKEAVAKLRPLVLTGQTLSVTTDCDQAIKKLQAATAEFPLAPEANRLLGFLYVEADYPAGAKHDYDASTASGGDPFFFAWVSPISSTAAKSANEKGSRFAAATTGNEKGSRFSLVQVKKDGLQVAPIFSPPQKKKKAKKGEAADEKEPEACQSVITAADAFVPQTPCGDFLANVAIKGIETKQMGIEITTAAKPIWIKPVNLFQEYPITNGPASRKYGNRYTRVIRRYMDNDVTKLGAEHMTGGEKTAMGMMIASAAMGGASGAMGAVNAAQAAISVSMAAIQTMQMIQNYRMETARLTRPNTYKPLPIDPAPLTFRVE